VYWKLLGNYYMFDRNCSCLISKLEIMTQDSKPRSKYISMKANFFSIPIFRRRRDSGRGDTPFRTPVIYAVNPGEIIMAHHTWHEIGLVWLKLFDLALSRF
jgi:hypothetical protein